MDDVRLNGRDVHNENPAEKLNYHGNLNATTNPLKGANFGYPSCVPAWDPNNLGQSGLKVGSLFKPDGVPNASDCASRQPGTLHFHAHTAPLDVKFNANGTSAYIAFHGSWYVPHSLVLCGWEVRRVLPPLRLHASGLITNIEASSQRNRQPADGYRVMRVDFSDGKPVAPSDSKTAAIPIMENSNAGACPGQCFRPVGLAFDDKGRLYVSSDSSGEVYVIYGA